MFVQSNFTTKMADNTVEQIRRVFEDTLGIIFVITKKNTKKKQYCGYSVESLRRGDSNDYPQHTVFMENY